MVTYNIRTILRILKKAAHFFTYENKIGFKRFKLSISRPIEQTLFSNLYVIFIIIKVIRRSI